MTKFKLRVRLWRKLNSRQRQQLQLQQQQL